MVARGKFFLYDAIVPALEAGKYTLTASLDIDAEDGSSNPVRDHELHLKVTAPRFKLPPDQALTVFPPANSEGAYEARLPQIVLRKKTLPWDRAAAPTGTVFNNQTVADHTPWLALVVIAEGEGQIVHDQPWQECVTPGKTLTGEADVLKASYLSVPQSTVDKVFPTIEDLSLLTNVREVNLDDTEAAMGDDDGFLAVVIANRLPQYDTENCKPKAYTACLINLENQLEFLPKKTPPRDFFEVADVFLNEAVMSLATAVGSGAAVPVTASAEPRGLDVSDAEAVAEAVRRGEVVFHEGELIDRAGVSGGTIHSLGNIDADSFLNLDFSSIAAEAETDRVFYRVEGAFGAFGFPLEAVVAEKFYRFPVLTSWRFTCSGAGSFETLMEGLDVGLLGTKAPGGYKRAFPPCTAPAAGKGPGDAPVARLPLEIAETGHVGLPHLTRTGQKANAWYRGPFSPHRLLRNPLADESQFPVLAHISDHLRMMTPEGREDVSLAVAFETGRLLAMSQPSFIASMLRWRAERFGAARSKANQRAALADRFNLIDALINDNDVAKLLSALERDQLARELEGGLIRELIKVRNGAICDPRILVDPAVSVPALQGDFNAFLADGLGLDRAVVDMIATATEDPRTMAAIQTAQPGLVSDGQLDLDDSIDDALVATLDTGLRNLAEAALGQTDIDAGAAGTIREFETLEAFVKNRFERR
jgi:hypothetical protein